MNAEFYTSPEAADLLLVFQFYRGDKQNKHSYELLHFLMIPTEGMSTDGMSSIACSLSVVRDGCLSYSL